MKILVTFLIHEKKALAQYIKPENGKVFYFDASLVIKKVMPSKQIYKVKIKGQKVVKVISQYKKKKIKKSSIVKILKQLEKDI